MKKHAYQIRILVCLMTAFATGILVSCAHVPSEAEKEQAQSKYSAGLSFIHQARSAGIDGDHATHDLKWRQSLAELLDAQKLDDKNASVQYLLGMVYFIGFQEHENAKGHVERAIDAHPGNFAEAEQLLGTILVDSGQLQEGIAHLEKARRDHLYQTPYFAEQELGWAKFKLHKYREASIHLRAAISSQPDLCGAYVRLADVEEARSDYEGAHEALSKFVTHCDTSPLRDACGPQLLAYGYYRLGMTSLKRGKNDQAADALQTCRDRFSDVEVAKECHKSLQLFN